LFLADLILAQRWRRAGNADARGPAIRKKMSSSGEIRIEASAKFCA
jgi:hypothetical protein